MFNLKNGSLMMALVYLMFTVIAMPLKAHASRYNLINGTLVPVELIDTVSTKTAQVGQSIKFRVLKDIVVANRLIIEAGAIALGQVTEVREPGAIGKPGSVGINVGRVTAVDGTLITLEGRKFSEGEKQEGASIALAIICCILFLLMQGQAVALVPGTTIDATVVANYEIRGRPLGKGYTPKILEPIKIKCTTKKCRREQANAGAVTSQAPSTTQNEEPRQKPKNRFNR